MGIAFKNAGFEIAAAWDFDKYAVQTYRANVGDHVRQQDIKKITYKDIPKADVWAFGFPCQDLSVAGKRRGMVLKCEVCGEEIQINPKEYKKHVLCPCCGSSRFKAASRSGCFFEIMRLIKETEENVPENMPAIIITENVKGLRPYLPVLNLEYERHGYTAHAQIFNSKYWNTAQNRERYAVVGTRECLGLHFAFPEEQHEFVPKLSSQLEKNINEKYFLPNEKAKTIIAQAAEKIKLKNCHACISPDWLNKKQNGPRAKEEEAPMFTLTAKGSHGVIERDGNNLRVRRLTPKEYGMLQMFPMNNWKQVVSDSQAYKQFGNAVTTTVFTAIAKEIKKSILEKSNGECSQAKECCVKRNQD